MLSRFCFLVFLLHAAAAQVSISVHTDKTEYLAGEPVVVLIDVQNTGNTPLVYGSGCSFDLKLEIRDLASEAEDQYGCGRRIYSGSCWGVDHPPQLQPGNSHTFRKLLQNYHLRPGQYIVQVTGKSEIARQFDRSGKVEGNKIAASLPIFVREGTEDELKRIYQPLVDAATRSLEHLSYEELQKAGEARYMARRSIAEVAPPFLFDLLKNFAHDKSDWEDGITGLARMNTTESRSTLVSLYEQSTDSRFQESVASSLESIAHPDQLEFFAGLLHGESAVKDRDVQSAAIGALGRIGGWGAVAALKTFHTGDAKLTDDLIYALGMTASQDAIPVLIKEYSTFNQGSPACQALTQLTHHAWCDVPPKRRPRVWSKWWSTHQEQLHIYNRDDCAWENPLPLEADGKQIQ